MVFPVLHKAGCGLSPPESKDHLMGSCCELAENVAVSAVLGRTAQNT